MNALSVITRCSMASAVLVSLAGCASTAPHYERPTAPVTASWPAGPSYKADTAVQQASPADELSWREFFAEPRLQRLIELALANNRDLRMATLAIERSRALYQIRGADLLPKIDASAAATLQRVPETLTSNGRAATTEQYSVGLGFTAYELDLFGRVRSLKDQALQQYLSTEYARRSAQISLVSQVATAYFNLSADRERLRLAHDTLTNQQEAYRLTKNRYEAGLASALALNQAQTTVDAARVETARLTTLAAQGENALAAVVGSPLSPELLPETLSDSQTALRVISPGISSDVLLKRPDILQAEAQLKGATANIGAARAAFFPRITLISSVGFGSDDLAALFRAGSFAWKFAPQITLPLFDGGSNQAGLNVSKVDRDIAVSHYEKTIQNAFRDVADALAQRGTVGDQLAAQRSLADAAAEGHRLSMARYENGIDSYLAVLDSQRVLYAAQQNLIGVRLTQLASQVNLYKALGGGDR